MSSVIYKYYLDLSKIDADGLICIDMPSKFKVLSVQPQGNDLMMWAMVSPDGLITRRYFEIIGTGHTMQDRPYADRHYLGTVQMPNGLVWHVFEVVTR